MAVPGDNHAETVCEKERPPAARRGHFRWAEGEESRLALLPIRHEDIWAFRKRLEALHWTAQEVDLSRDRRCWEERMTAPEREFVRHQLAFFARADIDVLGLIDGQLRAEADCMEAQAVYAAQEDQEQTHAESYALQAEAVMSGAELTAALEAVRTMPVVARMRAWVLGHFQDKPFPHSLVAFGAVEGVLFSASFAGLQWLRERKLLPGITEFNSFIARDEGQHTLFTCLLVRRYLRDPPSAEDARAIFAGALEVMDDFVDTSLPQPLPGLNAALLKQYVRFQADSVLADMEYPPLCGVDNPLPFMDKLTLNEVAKGNFFEVRPSQYQGVVRAGAARLALDRSDVPQEE